MQMKSTSRVPFKYGGALVQPHEEFSVKSARDAKMLAAVKRAALLAAPVKAAPPPAAPKRAYKRRDMVAEQPVEPAPPVEPVALAPADAPAWPFPTTPAAE